MSASPHGTDGHDLDGYGPDPTRRRRARSPAPPPTRGRWLADLLTARAKLISVLLTVSFVVVTVDIFVQGPLTALDIELQEWDGEKELPALQDAAWLYDKMGQRSVLVPILLLVAGWFARRHRTWRPVVLAMLSFVVLNVVVGAMKIVIGRAETESGSVDVLAGGVIYPSGHSSNMVLSGGLVIYLFWRYAADPPLRRLAGLMTFLTTLTIVTSLYIGSHWLTDLVAGVLVGGLLLQVVILFDRATRNVRDNPPTVLGRRLWFGRSAGGGLQADRDRVDAVPVAGGRLRRVVEEVAEV